MTPYIFFHFLPFLHSLNFSKNIKKIIKLIILISFAVFIGFRHERGGDWWLYLEAGRLGSVYKSIDDTVLSLIYAISYDFFDLGIYGVNIICGVIVIFCLNKFLTFVNNFSLGLFISFQSIVIFGAMGYMSQSLALAFGMLAIISLVERKTFNYIFFLILSSLSHASGVLFAIFIYSYLRKKINFKFLFIVLAIISLIFFLINQNEISRLIYYYIGSGNYFTSKGALPRVFISTFCAIIFFKYIRNTIKNEIEKNIFTIFAIGATILLPSVFFASTFIDRINFYFSIFQIYTLCKFLIILEKKYLKKLFLLFTIFIYHLIFIIWILFGIHSVYWVPYQLFPFQYCDKWTFPAGRFCNYFDYRINIDYTNIDRDFEKYRIKSEVQKMNERKLNK